MGLEQSRYLEETINDGLAHLTDPVAIRFREFLGHHDPRTQDLILTLLLTEIERQRRYSQELYWGADSGIVGCNDLETKDGLAGHTIEIQPSQISIEQRRVIKRLFEKIPMSPPTQTITTKATIGPESARLEITNRNWILRNREVYQADSPITTLTPDGKSLVEFVEQNIFQTLDKATRDLNFQLPARARAHLSGAQLRPVAQPPSQTPSFG